MKDIFERIFELKRERRVFCLTTLIKSDGSSPRDLGARMIVYPQGDIEYTIGGGALEKLVVEDAVNGFKERKNFTKRYNLVKKELEEGTPTGMACGGIVEVLFEYFYPEEILIIFGAGHIARAISEIAGLIGLSFIVVDNRKVFAKKEFFPEAVDVIYEDYKESFKKLNIDKNTYIVIVTYAHQFDSVCLEEALKTEAKYIGMIGSKNKVKTVFKEIEGKGLKIDERVHAPVGLDIGGKTPGEVALSIMAEIVKIKNRGSGKSMRELL